MPARRLPCPVGITATGQCYPPRIVRNDDLTLILDTTDEWIRTRTGIRERRWVEPGTSASDLAVPALRMALERRGLKASELDAILVATVTPDHAFPATACLVQDRVGAVNAFGFDLSAACSGFLYALTTGATLVAAGSCRKVAVIGVDVMSTLLDMEDRATAILFGDGAGAVLLEAVAEGHGLLDFEQNMDGSGAHFLYVPAGGSRLPASRATVEAKEHCATMNGKEIFRRAVPLMAESARLMLDRNGLAPADLGLFVPHQANLRIMRAAASRLELPEERMMVNIDRYANTTAATIPTALHQAVEAGRLGQGDLVILAAFGAGFTWGGALMKWAY
jgi:3-oxoacyl-[acyl-carrier-protein] synthase-3